MSHLRDFLMDDRGPVAARQGQHAAPGKQQQPGAQQHQPVADRTPEDAPQVIHPQGAEASGGGAGRNPDEIPQEILAREAGLATVRRTVFDDTDNIVRNLRAQWPFIEKYYVNSKARIENAGHTFGEDLSDADKKALTAFLATL
jgi:hypothetical protein